jgi:predicted nucleotidyltransferase
MRAFPLPEEQIREFCDRAPIRRLSVFGSVLTDRFNEESDIDLLVELLPGARVGYLAMAGMELQLCEIVGRKVDLRTPEELSRYFRQEVLELAEPIYVRS